MKITGTIHEIKDLQQISDTFKKRSCIVTYIENPQYPEYITFDFVQEQCGLLDDFQAGQNVEVHFNLKGRKWTSPAGEIRYFNTLQAWRILALQPNSSGETDTQPNAPTNPTVTSHADTDAASDELPF